MVSALWKASAEGRLQDVYELLSEPVVDLELKDHTGATALIEAVKNGHIDVARALLDRGADPTYGPAAEYTSDPVLVELLNSAAQSRMAQGAPHENGFVNESNGDTTKVYYGAPYGYYPPPPPEGASYYPPPPPDHQDGTGQPGPGNLPPADIARFIPCRYFPACRYGASCMFMHPTGPYFPGSLPSPAQYPGPYDSIPPQPYTNGYYPPSFQPPNGIPLASPHHVRSPSDMAPHHFSPSGPPAPYGSMPSSGYPNGPIPGPTGFPPPPSPHAMYPASLPVQYQQPQPDASATANHVPQAMPTPTTFPEPNGELEAGAEPLVTQISNENVAPGHRKSAPRRAPIARKPPCLFYPSGRCKNGADCRFPHVMPEPGSQQQQSFVPGRPGPRRSNGGYSAIEEKLAGLTLRDDQPRPTANGRPPVDGKRGYPAYKGNHAAAKRPPMSKQRVPQDDEFPTLAGNTLPLKNIVNGNGGPTAAQILQRPAPFRVNGATKDVVTRTPSPETPVRVQTESTDVTVVVEASPPILPVTKLPLSFAAMATAAVAPDSVKEISISA